MISICLTNIHWAPTHVSGSVKIVVFIIVKQKQLVNVVLHLSKFKCVSLHLNNINDSHI